MTISLAAVFIPILFMAGILGKLFREFAVTICVAVLISGFVSISLTPMLCSRVLRFNHGKRPNIISRWIESALHFTHEVYGRTLQWTVRHSAVMVLVFFAVVGATVYLYGIVPKGFIPDTDNDQLYVNTEVAQGTGFPFNVSSDTAGGCASLKPILISRHSLRLRGIAILAADPPTDACS